jgi:hypothetical protein
MRSSERGRRAPEGLSAGNDRRVKAAVGRQAKVEFTKSARMGAGSWIILIVLLLLLAASVAIAYYGWTLGDGVALPSSDYVAMTLGIVFSLGVGVGLMMLVFYSSRNGHDEPPVLIAPREALAKKPNVPGAPEQ